MLCFLIGNILTFDKTSARWLKLQFINLSCEHEFSSIKYGTNLSFVSLSTLLNEICYMVYSAT